jgi:hypothetical protein
MEIKNYSKIDVQPMYKWGEDTVMDFVSVSYTDGVNGSPKEGDMIAINPRNINDRWLVAAQWFKDNYKESDEEYKE